MPYLEEYDIETDTWRAISSNAPNPRDHTGGALIDGRYICVAGGPNGATAGWPSVLPTDCWDLEGNQNGNRWEVRANIPGGRGGSAYGTTCDGKLMVAGGEGGGRAWEEVHIFDGTQWTIVNPLFLGRHGTGLAADCACNQIHIASGTSAQGSDPEVKSVETLFPNGVNAPCLG